MGAGASLEGEEMSRRKQRASSQQREHNGKNKRSNPQASHYLTHETTTPSAQDVADADGKMIADDFFHSIDMQHKNTVSQTELDLVGSITKCDDIHNNGHFEDLLSLDKKEHNVENHVEFSNGHKKKRRKKKCKTNGKEGFPGVTSSPCLTVWNDDVLSNNATANVLEAICMPLEISTSQCETKDNCLRYLDTCGTDGNGSRHSRRGKGKCEHETPYDSKNCEKPQEPGSEHVKSDESAFIQRSTLSENKVKCAISRKHQGRPGSAYHSRSYKEHKMQGSENVNSVEDASTVNSLLGITPKASHLLEQKMKYRFSSKKKNDKSICANNPIKAKELIIGEKERKQPSSTGGVHAEGLHTDDSFSTKLEQNDDRSIEKLTREEDCLKEQQSSLGNSINNLKVEELIALNRGAMAAERPLLGTRKKLLVLDLNGLLADILCVSRCTHRVYKRVNGKSVFKRPFCDEFLSFCFKAFDIGVWSSRRRKNVDAVVDYIMGDRKCKLLFCWDLSKCTSTGFRTIENMHKPLVMKELRKLWDKEEPDLPWFNGEYSPSNTLLLDDSPYKALANPLHTAIFPSPYSYLDENDYSLGPEGDIRLYLEGLVMAEDVQIYVKKNAVGQHAITEMHPSWQYYKQVIEKVKIRPSSGSTRQFDSDR